MQLRYTPVVAALLAMSGTAFAQEEGKLTIGGWSVSGSLGGGLRTTDIEGGRRNGASTPTSAPATPTPNAVPVTFDSRDAAKASEYRDLDDGFIGYVDVQASSFRNYVKFFGENFGKEDQLLRLQGGTYGRTKFELYEDKMPHNLSWNALTPMAGSGSSTLTGTANINAATWNSFDYSFKRANRGFKSEFVVGGPWHLKMDLNEVNVEGIRPGSGRLGTGSGHGLEEFGYPVDYRTHNIIIDGGYSSKAASFALSYTVSEFKNYDPSVTWPNFYQLNLPDTTYLPPNNLLQKWGLNGTLRNLPMNSTLAARATYSKLTDQLSVPQVGLLPVTSAATTNVVTSAGYFSAPASSSTFNGDHKTKTLSLSLFTPWTRAVDSRIYIDYYDKENNSTPISYGATLGSGATNVGALPAAELFAYKKTDFGADVGWRVTQGNKVSGGVQSLTTDRDRGDSAKTEDRKLWAEYKNTMLDNLSGRLKFIYTERHGTFNPATPPGTSTNPNAVPYYFRAYDVANFNQPQMKLVLDWTPIPFLDLGFETAYKKTDYHDLYYGRKDDQREEYNFTAAYGDPNNFRVTALFNYENVKFNQAYRNTSGAGATPFPGTSPNATNFDWGTLNTQTNKLFGLIADWQANSRLKLKASYVWTQTGGGVDFSSGNTAGAGGFNGGPLVNYVTDNTEKQTFQIKGDYQVTKAWSGTLGLVHEKYSYNDDQMRGYQGYYPYYQNLGNSNASWFSGAYANPGYDLTVIYVMANYRFQ